MVELTSLLEDNDIDDPNENLHSSICEVSFTYDFCDDYSVRMGKLDSFVNYKSVVE